MPELILSFIRLVELAGPSVSHFLPELYALADMENQLDVAEQDLADEVNKIADRIFDVLGIQREQ